MSELWGDISDYHPYYPEVWDIHKPPLPPPNKEFSFWRETEESKQRRKEWQFRLDEYGENLSISQSLADIEDLKEEIFKEVENYKAELIKKKEPVILNRYQLMDLD